MITTVGMNYWDLCVIRYQRKEVLRKLSRNPIKQSIMKSVNIFLETDL